jgi:hypothetical protein
MLICSLSSVDLSCRAQLAAGGPINRTSKPSSPENGWRGGASGGSTPFCREPESSSFDSRYRPRYSMSKDGSSSQDSKHTRLASAFLSSNVSTLPVKSEGSSSDAPVLLPLENQWNTGLTSTDGVRLGEGSSPGQVTAASGPRASSLGSEAEGSKRQGADLAPGEAGCGGSLETFKQVRRRLEEALRRPGMRISAIEPDLPYLHQSPVATTAWTR